jgi:two-component system phosphate regulon sensor histidine kinase PhoR
MSGLRARLGLAALAASATALLSVLLLAGPALHRRAVEQTRVMLLAEARLMARVVEPPLTQGVPPQVLDALVDAAAQELQARVTVVAPDGRVNADSALSGPELLAMENHLHRPEVQQALASGVGFARRGSTTVGDELLYVAVAIRPQGRLLGVARVALSLSGVEEEARQLRRSVVLALAAAFLVTAVLAIALSAPLAGPLREIMEAARAFAAGDLSARSRVSRGDEVGELARMLNRSADELQERLTELARERSRMTAIVASLEEGLLAVDAGGRVLLANDSLRRQLGLNAPVGHHYLEVVRNPETSRLLQEVLVTGERREAEVAFHHLGRVFAVTGSPFPGAGDSPHGAVLTFRDVTERRRLEQVRRDFVANASHELRTPLTSIRGFVEALEDGAMAEAETAARFLGKIRTHADRMASLVSDLLELSRLEAGEQAPRWDLVSAGAVVEEALGSVASLAQARGIALTDRVETDGEMRTDADRLRRLLENLLENAIKYTPEGGHVELAARAAEGAIVLEVKDDGPGIPAAHLPRIFERFYRVDKGRSRELGGTGLGLSIVKHLAESIEAQVAVASQVGRGTTFTVRVPASSPP